MAHIGSITSRGSKVLVEWLQVNGQITRLVNTWAHRDDLVASVGESQGRGQAPALYDPARFEIEINTKAAFGEGVEAIDIPDLNERKHQFDYPKASGAIFHEASHARYTSWDLKQAYEDLKSEPGVLDALHLLEESRIEGMGVSKSFGHPENRPFLRSCALEIVLGDMQDAEIEELSGIRKMVHLAALTIARRDAGVLKKKDVAKFQEMGVKILGRDTLSKLSRIWNEFQTIYHPGGIGQIDRMYNLAREWVKVVNEAAKDEDQREQEIADALGDLMGMIAQAADSTSVDAEGDVQDQKTEEHRAENQKAREEEARRKGESKKASEEVFGKSGERAKDQREKKAAASGSHLVYGKSGTQIIQIRPPKAEERQAAIVVGKALERAKYHDRVRIESKSVVPPGRLKTRSVVQGAAYRSQNIHTQIEPWQRVTRRHEVDPNLTVGIMVDVSGSMSGAMEPMSVTAWVMSEALRRIQGTMAMVNYGHTVVPVLARGEFHKQVVIWNAPDGSEAFSHGFKALDGELDLIKGTGARLLVIVSDMNYKQGEIDAATKYLRECAKAGVAVICIGYGHATGARAQAGQPGVEMEIVAPAFEPAEVAKQIGAAAVRVLERAGAK